VAATYASAYLRMPATAMPCGFRFTASATSADETRAQRAAWWADASGIPPGAGVALSGATDATPDPTAPGIACLRRLWSGDDVQAAALRAAVEATVTRPPRADLPLIVAHGEADGLLPIAFTSEAWVEAAREAGSAPAYWRVPHAQHFDAFLPLPGFGERYVPLLPYGYAALDAMWTQLAGGAVVASRHFATRPRGTATLDAAALGLAR
jgi:hydroxybutyrate-dimer hydrolase